MKKLTLYTIVGLLVLVIAGAVVLAAPASPGVPPGQKIQAVTLTDAQKNDIAKIRYQMIDLRKQMLQTYVEAGAITQEMADARIAMMKANLDNAVKNGHIGMGRGMGMKHGRMGRGMGPAAGCPYYQGQPQPNK